MQKITPFLWFDNQAEEAMNFYTSIFKNSKPGKIARYGESGPGPKGSVMTAAFQLEGQEFVALNGGWLTDKYGVSWQIVPTILPELLQSKDPGKAQKTMKAMLQMKKLDIAALKKAAEE